MSDFTVSTRHARILRILSQLQAGAGLNATELACELNVSRRTVFRDLNMMRSAGVKLYYDDQLDCYRLSPQENLMATPALDHDELTILVAAVHLSVLRNLPDCHGFLRQSINKLLAGLPDRAQHHLARVIKSCSVRDAEDVADVKTVSVIQRILSAISQRKILRVTVFEPESGSEVVTHFAPYRIIAAADSWRVLGRSSHHRGVRTFDPRHMTQPEVIDEIYAIPPQFQSAG